MYTLFMVNIFLKYQNCCVKYLTMNLQPHFKQITIITIHSMNDIQDISVKYLTINLY